MRFIKLLRRWVNMITGKSSFHVEQNIGKYYSKTKVKGYYNDLTNKVSEKTFLDSNGIPINTTINNVNAYFPISIFQYGLGLYDLFLETKDKKYYNKFIKISNWAIENQKESGLWECMGTLNDKAHETQSSMCQSEGASILLRAYIETDDMKYYEAAKQAIDYMLIDVKDGGTCFYENEEIIFQEYVSKYNLSVLNGWIFSIFGLFDFTLICNERKYKDILDNTLKSLANNLKKYDRGFWSSYDNKGTIASPSYHDLHIKQLKLLYDIFKIEEFNIFARRWENYQAKKYFKIISMIIKLKQKIFRNKYYDINTSLIK